jgi:hypothetical protein
MFLSWNAQFLFHIDGVSRNENDTEMQQNTKNTKAWYHAQYSELEQLIDEPKYQ